MGVDNNGEIQYLKNIFYQDNGCAPNETISPVTAAHFVGNCYDSRRWYVEANSAATDSPSNTWCRAPCKFKFACMFIKYLKYFLLFLHFQLQQKQ